MSEMTAIAPDHGHRQGRHEDVVVLDVAELVGEDPFELDSVHLLEQPCRYSDGGVLWVPARRECVRGDVVDDVDPRHRQARGDRQPLDEVVEALVLLRVRRLGAADRERDGVGLPVRPDGQRRGDEQRDDDAHNTEADDVVERPSNQDQQDDEADDQHRGAALV